VKIEKVIMARDSHIDDIMDSIDMGMVGITNTFIPAPRIQFTAHPFTAEELDDFVVAGEHLGIE
jgi:hypothetical protein